MNRLPSISLAVSLTSHGIDKTIDVENAMPDSEEESTKRPTKATSALMCHYTKCSYKVFKRKGDLNRH